MPLMPSIHFDAIWIPECVMAIHRTKKMPETRFRMDTRQSDISSNSSVTRRIAVLLAMQ